MMWWAVFVIAAVVVVCSLAGLIAVALDGMDEEVEVIE